jgi:hypothetical protein
MHAAPNASLSGFALSQLQRSARASKGLADACTPLSPTLGTALSLSSFQFSKMALRAEPSAAVTGSVAPSTLPRKSSQLQVHGGAHDHVTMKQQVAQARLTWREKKSARSPELSGRPLDRVPSNRRRWGGEHGTHRHVEAVDDKHLWCKLSAVEASSELWVQRKMVTSTA